ERFQDDDARHHGTMRKMAREEWLVHGDVLERANRFPGMAFEHSIDQQEWITMGKPPHHLVDVHRQAVVRLLFFHSGSSLDPFFGIFVFQVSSSPDSSCRTPRSERRTSRMNSSSS